MEIGLPPPGVGTQTEVVVEVGTVDGEVGRTAVHAAEAHAVAAVGRETGDVGQRTAHRRHVLHLFVVDVSGGARLERVEFRSLCRDNDFTQLLRVLRERHREAEGLTKLKRDVLHLLRLIADVADFDGVRPPGRMPLMAKAPLVFVTAWYLVPVGT